MKHEIPDNFPDYVDYAQDKLQNRLKNLCFPIIDTLYINGHRNIQRKGTPKEWFYIIRFHKDKKGNVSLKCSAGFTQIGDQFDISIPISKSQIKKKK